MSPRDVSLSSADAQEEYEEMMRAAWPPDAGSHDTGACANRMAELVDDAVQAGRGWAVTVERRGLIAGYESIGKRWAKRHNRLLVVTKNGSSSVASRVGRRRRLDDGSTVHQQSMIEVLTWSEVAELLTTIERQISALFINRTAYTRLLALRERHPDSVGPAEAANAEGTTIEAVLGGEWAA